MGLTTQEFLSMDIWQYNAYSLAWKARTRDALALEIQGAWMTGYWGNPYIKHKRSLKQVLKDVSFDRELPREKVNAEDAEKRFRQFEELQKYGWTKE